MNFASQGQIRQMGTGAFKRASDVAGGIGRVAGGRSGILGFIGVPGANSQKQNGKWGLATSTSTTVVGLSVCSLCAISWHGNASAVQSGPGQAEGDVIAPCGASGRRGKEKGSTSKLPIDGQSLGLPADCAFQFHTWLHLGAPNDDTWQGSQTALQRWQNFEI